MKVCVLAGGTGGAMLAQGFHEALGPGELSVVCNTGDDTWWHGIHVSPDVDAVLYRLAGIFDEERRFGIRGDTFHAARQIGSLGEPDWFNLGDRDLAVCLLRTELVTAGTTLTAATAELARRMGVESAVVPMADTPVTTWIETAAGRLDVQQWMIRERQEPRVLAVEFEGPAAGPAPAAVAAVAEADLVVIGPSNPVISVDPMLAVLGPHLPRQHTVAITPIVGGKALKGPTVRMLEELGRDATVGGVARHYAAYAARFVVDVEDAALAGEVEAAGCEVAVLDTVMGLDGRRRLAEAVIGLVG